MNAERMPPTQPHFHAWTARGEFVGCFATAENARKQVGHDGFVRPYPSEPESILDILDSASCAPTDGLKQL